MKDNGLYHPLAEEVTRQQKLFATFTPALNEHPSLAEQLATSSPKRAICLFTDSLDPSGMGEHMLTLAAELRKRYHILFVCPLAPKVIHF